VSCAATTIWRPQAARGTGARPASPSPSSWRPGSAPRWRWTAGARSSGPRAPTAGG
jgi:hypothetical protein